MRNRSGLFPLPGLVSASFLLGFALSANAQEKPATQAPAKPKAECNAYRVDNTKNRVYFNAPEPWIAIPTQTERNQLRGNAELGQVFVMENCDTPNLIARVKVHGKPDDAGLDGPGADEIASGQPVLILEQRGEWHRIRGRPAIVGGTELWKGEGWVKTDKKVILVKY